MPPQTPREAPAKCYQHVLTVGFYAQKKKRRSVPDSYCLSCGACAECLAQRRLLRNCSAIRWYNRCVPAKPVPWVWKFMESRAAQVRANQRAGLLRPLLFSPFVVLLRVRFEFAPYFENEAGNRCYRREGEQDFLKHGIAPISRSAARIGLCRHAQRVPKGKRKVCCAMFATVKKISDNITDG